MFDGEAMRIEARRIGERGSFKPLNMAPSAMLHPIASNSSDVPSQCKYTQSLSVPDDSVSVPCVS